MTEASIPESAAQQRIDARPWQDPFAAIEKSFDKTDKLNPDQQCLKTLTSSNAQESPLTEKEHETLVIGVMVPGSAYSEDAEHRGGRGSPFLRASHVRGSYRKTRATLNISRGHTLPGTSALPRFRRRWCQRDRPCRRTIRRDRLGKGEAESPSHSRPLFHTNGLNKFRDASGTIKNKS
jgi:hypothetical protein